MTYAPGQASPRERARHELEADPRRSDKLIAVAADVSPQTVARVRHMIETGQPLPRLRQPPSRKGMPGSSPASICTPGLPPQPGALAERGLCARHPQPDLWSSDKQADRQAAQHVCWACPVISLCAEWAASLPSRFRVGVVYAGRLPKHWPVPADDDGQHDMRAAG